MSSQPISRLAGLAALAFALTGMSGCFGNGDGPESIPGTPQPRLTGLLIDAPISGAAYRTSGGDSGTTTGAGEFEYVDGENITFTIGDIELGSVPAAPIITPVELTRNSDPNDTSAVNQLVFLQSLDADGNPANGITISAAAVSAAEGRSLDFSSPTFREDAAALLQILAPNATLIGNAEALSNFYATYVEMGGSDTFNFNFSGFPPVGSDSGFVEIFSDDFDIDGAPDATKWNIETGYGPDNSGWGNNEWQLYTSSSDNVRVEDGNLVIQARCDTPPCGVRDGTVTSARINTKDKFEFRFGKVFARIKPPTGEGSWPAFWSLGANFPETPWPRAGEMDFMEIFPSVSNDRTTHFTIHWCDQTIQAPAECSFPQGRVLDSQSREFPEPLGDDFHIFEADWDGNRIIGKMDNVEVFSRTIDATTMEEFLREFFLILNVAMGGTLGSDNQPPSGNEVWPQTMLVDYVRVFQRTDDANFSIDFEDAPASYDFGEGGGFEGALSDVIDNPESGGINTSDQVGRMRKFGGQPFAGSRLTLPTPIDVFPGTSFNMAVWSQRPVAVTFKLEGATEAEVVAMHGGSGWELLNFVFPDYEGSVEGITLIFDNGIIGDATNDPLNWTFYFDDIEQLPPQIIEPPGLDQIDLPITFDDATVDYTVIDFGGAQTTLSADPDDATNVVASTLKPVGAETFAGTTTSTNAGLASAIPFSATATTIGMRVYSPDAGIPVRMKAEDVDDATIAVEAEVLTTVANEWETLVFDFSDVVTGPALDLSQSYSKLNVFFNFDTDGDTAGAKTYLWDDVEFGVMAPVVDDVPPTLSSVSIASDNANPLLATTGDTVTLLFTANEAIAAPVVTIGGAEATVSGAGTTWEATRTLTSADADGAIAFTIEFADLVGNVGIAVTATDNNSSVTLDATAPTATLSGAPSEFTSLDDIPLTLTFSEAVSGVELSDIVVTNGAARNFVAVDAATYTVNVAPNGVGDLMVGVADAAALDAAGNASSAATMITVENRLDADAPGLISISIASSNSTPDAARTGDVITLVMTASEDIVTPAVIIGGGPADLVTGAGAIWIATRTLLATDPEGAVAFLISFEDLGGNAGQAASVTTDGSSVVFDITAPGVEITGAPATIVTLDSFTVTVSFDEDVSGFEATDLNVVNAVATDFTAVDASTYTASITPDGNGTVSISVAADVATDAPGNGNTEVSVSADLDLQPLWTLVWSDDFGGSALNAANWTARTDADCPAPCNGVQDYTADNVIVAAGALIIEGREAAGPTYSSGLIDTRGKLEFLHGRIEIDARLPGTLGTRPSLFLLPVDDSYGPWPQSGEIDLVNAPDLGPGNGALEHTLQYGLPVPENTATTVASEPANPAISTTLTYALEWEAGEIRWFVDDVHIATQTEGNWYAYGEDADGVYALGTGAAPFDQNFYLAIGLGIADTAGAGSIFPQSLQIDAVRIFECANAIDPVAGTGCGTSDTPLLPIPEAPGEPFTESVEVYTDALATLGFVDAGDPDGPLVSQTLTSAPTQSGGATVNASNTGAIDGTDVVWSLDINAAAGSAGVTVGAPDNGPTTGFFDLTGAETAGEILLRMRVISATAGTDISVGLNGVGGASGRDSLTYTPDGEWQQYSVKIADVITDSVASGTTLDMANLTTLFALDVTGGSAVFNLDDIQVIVACRDTGTCAVTPRLPNVVSVPVYSQNFDGIDITGGIIGDGWRFFNNVFESGTRLFGYSGAAPNGPQICALTTDQGGPDQGTQQFSVYSDYECCGGGGPNNGPSGHQSANGLVETNVFIEPRSTGANAISADDVGDTWTFAFDAKRGNLEGASRAFAFIKVLDPASGFTLTAETVIEMTTASIDWQRYEAELTIGDWEGQVIQVGFQTTAANFEASAVFYDNIEVTSVDGP